MTSPADRLHPAPGPWEASSAILRGLLSLLLLLLSVACAGNGERITVGDPPARPGALAPRLVDGRDGLWLTWLEPAGHGHRLLLARLTTGGEWSSPREIAAGDDLFANWADRPGVGEAADGSLIAHWLEMLGDGPYDYGVRIAHSDDDGRSWRPLGLLHDDETPAEHGFVSWVQEGDALRAFWLDGRAMPDGGPMQLRTAVVGDGGPSASELLDERVCECCDTTAARTANGAVVVYRDRSAGEIRDFAAVRERDDGWSASEIVHPDGWEIAGCPVNGAAVDVLDDRVAVGWFTGADDEPRVLAAFSDDDGVGFSEPLLLDDRRPLGRVDLTSAAGGGAWVSWMRLADPDGAEIRLRRVTVQGPVGPATVVTTTSPERSAGVPQLARLGDLLVLVWVEVGEPSTLRAASLTAGSFSAV